MPTNVNTTLLEVRKAYRLLFEYQTRILDLIGFVGGSFQYEYQGGFPKFSNSGPNNNAGRLDLLAWDWLNMYYYEFKFEAKKNKTDNIHFSLFLLNDTGYYQTLKNNKENKKDKIYKSKVSAYEPVESSKSKLIFVVGKNTWHGWGNNWSSEKFLFDEDGQSIKDETIMLFKSYFLDDFFDEDSAIDKLRDFEEYCGIHGVDFKYKEKTIK